MTSSYLHNTRIEKDKRGTLLAIQCLCMYVCRGAIQSGGRRSIYFIYIIEQKHNMYVCNGKYRINTSIQALQDSKQAHNPYNNLVWVVFQNHQKRGGRTASVLKVFGTPPTLFFAILAGYSQKLGDGSGSFRQERRDKYFFKRIF